VRANVVVTREKPARPPLVRLFVDVTIDHVERDCFIVIPAHVPHEKGEVDKLEIYDVGVGRFLGPGAMYAFKVKRGARVTLRNLEIGAWTDAREISVREEFDFEFDGLFEGVNPIDADVDMSKARHVKSVNPAG
jgi:hypothetical protein